MIGFRTYSLAPWPTCASWLCKEMQNCRVAMIAIARMIVKKNNIDSQCWIDVWHFYLASFSEIIDCTQYLIECSRPLILWGWWLIQMTVLRNKQPLVSDGRHRNLEKFGGNYKASVQRNGGSWGAIHTTRHNYEEVRLSWSLVSSIWNNHVNCSGEWRLLNRDTKATYAQSHSAWSFPYFHWDPWW